MPTLPFPRLLELIADRSAALREAAAQAPPAAQVPGCPGWSVPDLVAHLGEVQRFWAAVVAAGPGQPPPDDDQVPGRSPAGDPLAWSAASTEILLAALTEAGPSRGCWAWWQSSPVPADSGAVARHQVQEAAVHAWDAQQAAGRPLPLPADAAADGVAEFITAGLGSMGAWPHAPGRVALLADDDDGGWPLDLGPAGAALAAGPGSGAAATIRGTASDLVLYLYGRDTAAPVRTEGDSGLVSELAKWAPTD
jgi:uncharacterized protein (TIGR03083 family)